MRHRQLLTNAAWAVLTFNICLAIWGIVAGSDMLTLMSFIWAFVNIAALSYLRGSK